MKSGNCLILLIVLLPTLCSAQSKILGLGRYRIDVTTPDSLPKDFSEDEPSYVKGTIALPCTHIRTFSSLATKVAGISVSNLCLAFYDNKLFRISGNYSVELQEVFRVTYGKGSSELTRQLSLCDKNRPMSLGGESWQTGDLVAYVVHARGYTSDCTMQETNNLIIKSQRLSALASDCDLSNNDLLTEEFEKIITNHQEQGTRKEKE